MPNKYQLLRALQKCIRRGLEYQAMFFATQLEDSGHITELWNDLRVVASEDIGMANPMLPVLLETLEKQYKAFNSSASQKQKRRLFLSHAILSLCRSEKSRVVNEFLVTVYGARKEGKKLPIPPFAKVTPEDMEKFLEIGAKLENESKKVWNPYKKTARNCG